MLGLILQQTSVTQTWRYISRTAGLEANYPAGWLVDETGPYVARLRSPGNRPFKTQYLITTVPAGGQTSVRNVLDSLTLQRSVSLSAYRVLSVEEVSTGGSTFTRMKFAFVDADPNPFIQRLPVVVLGMDVVIIDGNRAIILTYMADQDTYDSGLAAFERFLGSLTY
ncbi:MAG: hypothetical protein IT326_01450 [Anaerolineae bacterium]|nr:hypothetical protein [Anaerolineae bacterium]